MEASEFEIDAVALKETETALLVMKTGLAYEAVNGGAARWLGELWGCSTQTINRLAAMFEVFNDDEIRPDVPLSLYGAVMETDDPQAWLERALAEGLSARQVRDANDNLRGKHLSNTAFRGRVTITVWDVVAGRVTAEGLAISGAMPDVAEMIVREVLEKEKTE